MSDVVARRVRIHGEVQGVVFRDSTQREAAARGVGGWVRNCADGTVEAWFEGPVAEVDALIDWTRTGPPRASVGRVSVADESPSGCGSSFEVR